MKSTKVMSGFLVAVLAAVSFVGCNHAMTQKEYLDAQKKLGQKTLAEQKPELEKRFRSQMWQQFCNTNSRLLANLKYEDVSKDDINKAVEDFNKNQKPSQGGKFDASSTVYAQIKYIGNGEKTTTYAGKNGDEVKNLFSQRFDIDIVGDVTTDRW